MPVRNFHRVRLVRFLVAATFMVAVYGDACFGQAAQPKRPGPPTIDLLKLSGSQPSLTPAGEGITAIKISDLFAIGKTEVKPYDSSFKIDLPAGYAIFNDLVYMIDSKAVFSGPNDFVFRIPSAVTKESFDQLRILVIEYDDAEPRKPRWTDVTLMPEMIDAWKDYLSKVEFEKRLPDFATRTLHGFMWERNRVLVVATKDSSVARDRFVADLVLAVKPEPATVMEGRDIQYTFTVTNRGPDTATGVSLKSYVDPDFVSLTQSQGVCRWDAHNVYCNLGEIPKGASATVTFHGKCRWNFYFGDQPVKSGGMDATPRVEAAEGDPNYENNQVFASATVVKDPNKAPVVTIDNPTRDQFFVGPGATVKIVATASDPDGTISKIEVYDGAQLIGSPKLVGKNQYELTCPNVPYGQHFLTALVEDNQGRPGSSDSTFFVNGQATVEVVSPKAKQVINGPVENIAVTVHASDPVRQIKKVEVHLGSQLGGLQQVAVPTAIKNEYTTSFKEMGASGTYSIYVVATDDAGVDTITYPIEFRIAEPPRVSVAVVEGGYAKDIESGKILSASRPIALQSSAFYLNESRETRIVSFELFANEKPICKRMRSENEDSYEGRWLKCTWSPPSGKYTLVAIVTDSDGQIGKSTPVEVVIR